MSSTDRPSISTDSSNEEIVDLDDTGSEGFQESNEFFTLTTLDPKISARIKDFPKPILVDFEDILNPLKKAEVYKEVANQLNSYILESKTENLRQEA